MRDYLSLAIAIMAGCMVGAACIIARAIDRLSGRQCRHETFVTVHRDTPAAGDRREV